MPPVSITADSELCFGRGVEGVSGELLDASGMLLEEPWAKALYFPPGSAAAGPSLEATTTNASGYFFNVPAGNYQVRLKRSDGRRMICDLDPTRSGVSVGWPVEGAEHTYHAIAEESLNVVVVRVFCEVQ